MAEHSPEKHKVDKALEFANRLVLEQIQTKLKKQPDANLAPFFRQQEASYSQLVATVAANDDIVQDESKQVTCPEAKDERPNLAIDASAEIIHPLDKSILGGQAAESPDTSSQLPEQAVAGLNQAIREGDVLWHLHSTFVISLSSSEVVKIGMSLDLDGIENLRYLNSLSLDVPMPQCLGTLRSGPRIYSFMSRAAGQPLDTLWPQLSNLHKESIQQQLEGYLAILRSVSRGPSVSIGGFASGVCKDIRRDLRTSNKPIQTEDELNGFLCRQDRRTQTPWIKMIRASMTEHHKLVATHGDLHPRNIMVTWDDEDKSRLRITSIIDWELGGWYPEYWEFVKALHTINPKRAMADWCAFLPTGAIGSWPVEFAIDTLISRWLG